MMAYEVEELVANDRINQWEFINEPDPDFGREKEAARSLKMALVFLDKASDWINQAISDVEGLKSEDEITEQSNLLDDLVSSITSMKKKLEGGYRL